MRHRTKDASTRARQGPSALLWALFFASSSPSYKKNYELGFWWTISITMCNVGVRVSVVLVAWCVVGAGEECCRQQSACSCWERPGSLLGGLVPTGF